MVVQVTRRATRFWIWRLLRTKNVTAHNASTRTMTMAAIPPPERWEELFAAPPRKESAEVAPSDVGVVLPETGLWGTGLDVSGVGVGVEAGGGDDDDDGVVSDDPVTAGSVELGTEPEKDSPPGIIGVTVDVKAPATVVGEGGSPMTDACASVTTVVGSGVPVVRTLRP